LGALNYRACAEGVKYMRWTLLHS